MVVRGIESAACAKETMAVAMRVRIRCIDVFMLRCSSQKKENKVKQINLLEPLPFEEPKEPELEKMEVTDEESVSDDIKTDLEEDGQIGLSFE